LQALRASITVKKALARVSAATSCASPCASINVTSLTSAVPQSGDTTFALSSANAPPAARQILAAAQNRDTTVKSRFA
jgi:hypothetical protein